MSTKSSRLDSVKSSFVSNISIDSDTNYFEAANLIALLIFDDYLRINALNFANINNHILNNLYDKFGCEIIKQFSNNSQLTSNSNSQSDLEEHG